MLNNKLSSKADQAATLLSELAPAIIQGIQAGVASKHNITNLQLFIIVIIEHNGKQTMSVLAKKLHMSMPRTTGLVNRLIKQNLLMREASPDDRRLVIVSLSAKGAQLVTSYKMMIKTRWQQVLGGLSDQDIEQFMGLIKKISEKVRAA